VPFTVNGTEYRELFRHQWGAKEKIPLTVTYSVSIVV
jgi:hypothetical protein